MGLVASLLRAGAEPSTQSSAVEVVVEVEDLGPLQAKLEQKRVAQHMAGPPCLDLGDLLLAGELCEPF